MIVFILGNGYSRKGISCEFLRSHGLVIGCNAIYRTETPDILVAVDRPMRREIEKSSWDGPLVTNEDYSFEKPYKYSGYIALHEAMRHDPATVYILGFDYSGAKTNRRMKKYTLGRNLYAGSANYKMAPPTDNHFRVRARIEASFFKKYMDVKFVRVVDHTSGEMNLGIEEISKTKFIKLARLGRL